LFELVRKVELGQMNIIQSN